MVPEQVPEELTEEEFMVKWNCAFSDPVMDLFKKRYGSVS